MMTPDCSRHADALSRIKKLLATERAVPDLRLYITTYPGRRFDREIGHQVADDFTLQDLRAVRHLGVSVSFTTQEWLVGEGREEVRLLLQSIPSNLDIWEVPREDINAMLGPGKPAATSAANDREKGFEEGISEFPGIKVVAQQSANFDRTDGLNVMTNLYQAHPNIAGVFAANDEMALGAVKAVGAKAGHQIKVVAFDGTPDGLKAVQAGQINVDIAQQPKLLGQLAVEAAAKAAEGGKVPANDAIPVKIATSANVAQFLSAS